jgi:hypothetical protein
MPRKNSATRPTDQVLRELEYTLSPLLYAREVLHMGSGDGPLMDEYQWQVDVLESESKRKAINGARQIGKSTLVAVPPVHRARWYPRSLWIVAASTESQAKEDMLKIKDLIAQDPEYPEYTREGSDLLAFRNGARIVVVPATEKAGGRSFSNPDGITLDEDSWIPDSVYRSSVRPLLTHNKKCQVFLLSTPNGRQGHFYRANRPILKTMTRWERFEIRCPYEPDDVERILKPYMDEAKYRAIKAKEGIRAYYSPRHWDLEEQLENLDEMGPRMYRQEECCEFVESEDQVFSNADIEAMYSDALTAYHLGSAAEQSDDVQEFIIRPRGGGR